MRDAALPPTIYEETSSESSLGSCYSEDASVVLIEEEEQQHLVREEEETICEKPPPRANCIAQPLL